MDDTRHLWGPGPDVIQWEPPSSFPPRQNIGWNLLASNRSHRQRLEEVLNDAVNEDMSVAVPQLEPEYRRVADELTRKLADGRLGGESRTCLRAD